MQILNIIAWVYLTLFILSYLLFSITLIREQEPVGLMRFSGLFLPVLGIKAAVLHFTYPAQPLVLSICIALTTGALIFTLLPLRPKSPTHYSDPAECVDERLTPFARFYKLKPDSDEFRTFYQEHPELNEKDTRTRSMPDLQTPESKTWHPLTSQFSNAAFQTIELFAGELDHKKVTNKKNRAEFDPKDLTEKLKGFAQHLDADCIGATKLNPKFIYSHIGRGEGKFGDRINLNHTHAIVIGVKMDPHMIRHAPQNPVITESSVRYLETVKIAITLTHYLRQLGFSARAHTDTNYRTLCIPIAIDAGLGELGRHGLLIHPRLGSMLRLAVVTTDAKLAADTPVYFGVQNFCAICKKCAEVCPASAIEENEKKNHNGIKKWQTRADDCYQYWRTIGTDCAICLKVCPYSHPDTVMHRIIRWFLARNRMLHKPALWAEGWIYDHRMKTKYPIPEWHKK